VPKRRRNRTKQRSTRRRRRRPKPTFAKIKTNFPPGVLLHSAILPIAITNDNDGRTKHYGISKDRRIRYERKLRSLGHERQPFGQQTDVVVTHILGPGQKKLDSSSILRGNFKEIEDALVWLGWWHDDSPAYIRCVLPLQDATQRDMGPAIRIDVYASGAIQIRPAEAHSDDR
jgi:hypothetical protein